MTISRFIQLFSGLQRAHIAFVPGELDARGKLTGRYVTLREGATLMQWQEHLSGRLSLGVCPIDDESKCMFGAIDIDVYSDKNLVSSILEKIIDLPLVAVLSKSGGVHLYVFFKEAAAAGALQKKLREIAAFLGFAQSEIFPKQTKLVAERGDVGSCINVPYCGEERHAIINIGGANTKLTLEEFVELAEAKKASPAEFLALNLSKTNVGYSGIPPCMEQLLQQGISEGGRNSAMFNLAVYLNKSGETDLFGELSLLNAKYVSPPLPASEIKILARDALKEKYFYTCDQPPIRNFCNKTECRKREFGIGQLGTEETPELSGLSKFDSKPPLWFLDVEGIGRVELTTEQLLSPRAFQKACLESFNVYPPTVKELAWQKLIRELMVKMTIIEAPVEIDPINKLEELLNKYLTSAVRGISREEILIGKPFAEGGEQYFRLTDFLMYLQKRGFHEMQENQITKHLKELGVEAKQLKIHGRNIRLWGCVERVPQTFAEVALDDRII